jgi:two-component sensor histidine kinase
MTSVLGLPDTKRRRFLRASTTARPSWQPLGGRAEDAATVTSPRGFSNTDQLLLVEEISHRVVNQYAIAIATIGVEASRVDDEGARAALERAASQLRAQANAHRALQPPVFDGDVDLGAYLGRLCAALHDAMLRESGVKLALAYDEVDLAAERCWRVGLIFMELMTNSLRHGFKGGGGAIVVEVRLVGEEVHCQVADDGGSHPNPAASRGRRVIAGLAQELGGAVTWDFGAAGVTADLSFPLL